MGAGTTLESQVAVRLMENDFTFARRFIGSVLADPENTLIPLYCMNNYISLFVYESHRALKEIDPARATLLNYENGVIIERVRHTVKLFKDTGPNKGMVGVSQYFDDLLTAFRQHLRSKVWLPAARAWVDDLGLWSYRGRLVTTTQVASFYLGATPQELADPKSLGLARMAVGESQGGYIARFLGTLPWEGPTTFVNVMNLGEIENEDVKTEKYFKGAFDPAFDDGMVGALTAFRCALNFLDVMLSGDKDIASAETVFKIKFVTLYQVMASLRELRSHYGASVTGRSQGILDAILGHSTTALMLQRNRTGFRNTLIHYRPTARVTAQLSLSLPLCGLVEAYYPGYDFLTLSQEIDEHIVRVAELCEEWAQSN
ncbi:hypothetical protein ACFWP3_27240 [Streptomyces sp. NPDC058525]|uniref:hypothetical protein n=1 Tax=Streptomyces sp. NPDC058525 TaxID=3346538 RepID=UPI0036501270